MESLIVTAGSNYLDIDAYACMVAYAELLRLQGKNAVAYSKAPCNYSVCSFLKKEGQVTGALPSGVDPQTAEYVIVDVSDPDYIRDAAPLAKVVEIYDHHTGFEAFWKSRIGERSRIEFIGAAATLIYREWKASGQEEKLTPSTALLLIAAILDNTLNLTSSNTAKEDINAFEELCKRANVGGGWRSTYFEAVQKSMEADLRNALFGDIKRMRDDPVLPPRIAQLCVWDAESLLERLPEIREWFGEQADWMLNVIDISKHRGYFICEDKERQKRLEKIFGICFMGGVAVSSVPYLRKEIIKKIEENKINL